MGTRELGRGRSREKVRIGTGTLLSMHELKCFVYLLNASVGIVDITISAAIPPAFQKTPNFPEAPSFQNPIYSTSPTVPQKDLSSERNPQTPPV
jgi:hypothetical protein